MPWQVIGRAPNHEWYVHTRNSLQEGQGFDGAFHGLALRPAVDSSVKLLVEWLQFPSVAELPQDQGETFFDLSEALKHIENSITRRARCSDTLNKECFVDGAVHTKPSTEKTQ